jgi:hypothetical protein
MVFSVPQADAAIVSCLLGCDSFLANSFQFIIHSSPHHFILRSRVDDQTVDPLDC